MNAKNKEHSPKEFYKTIRPEYFSDSEVIYETQLPKEVLAFELDKISTNQKQDEFETLCRRLAEKFISPNLIPQVGPTGGGDGKTDSETYAVSDSIAERWFIVDNGWKKDENWAFAFSAKKTWKSKAKSDVKKIVETNRGYTKVFFITNQTPSSKKKKDAQEEFLNEFKIDVTILDGEWILEKIYSNDLIDLVVDALNLSTVYKNKKTTVGQNDAGRLKQLSVLEDKINNTNRYFEHDFQLVEDALESAILSRMVEKPKEEIEGKFERAFRFCKKVDNKKQWIRLHYQRAWTYYYFFDDFDSFLEEYQNLKKYIDASSSISEIELYFNLISTLKTALKYDIVELSKYDIKIEDETNDLYNILKEVSSNDDKPCSALIAKTFISFHELMDLIDQQKNPDKKLIELSEYFSSSQIFLDFPFESFYKIVEVVGNILPNNLEYDNLIDNIALISEKRSSQLASGWTYFKRGTQKLSANYFKESIIYFGKAVFKFAKEESQDKMYFTLRGLSVAYRSLGLVWASNNCLISAATITLRAWYEKGILNQKTYDCAKDLATNELFIGRIPTFLGWYELLSVISTQLAISLEADEVPPYDLLDGCLSVRLLNTDEKQNSNIERLPKLFEQLQLFSSQNACLFKLGYNKMLLDEYAAIGIENEKGLNDFYEMAINQPFKEQMIYETNFLNGETLELNSKILGCNFQVSFSQEVELLMVAETLLAFFESFLATSLQNVFPHSECIKIKLIKSNVEGHLEFSNLELANEYQLEVNNFNFSINDKEKLWSNMIEFSGDILARNFFVDDLENHLIKLFKKEEISERLSLVFEHRNFLINILGENPKLFLENWDSSYPLFSQKREGALPFERSKSVKKENNVLEHLNPEQIGHDKRKVYSVIEVGLWDDAKWNGFGFFIDKDGLSIFLGYQNEEYGKNIFKNWMKRFGEEDKKEEINITIVRGVNKDNPYWYRVIVSSNLTNVLEEGKIFTTPSRFHEMTTSNPQNLKNLIDAFNAFGKFRLCPAKLIIEKEKIEPYSEHSILKKNLFIKNAWEIGENDFEQIAIRKNDNPIIPKHISNAPVLNVLKRKNIPDL